MNKKAMDEAGEQMFEMPSKPGLSRIYDKYHLCRAASLIGDAFLFMALVQTVFTVVVPVGAKSSPIEVYSRNFSSVISLALLGFFLCRWSYINQNDFHKLKTMKRFSILTFLVIAASLAKVVISVIYTCKYLNIGNNIGFYYLIDSAAWFLFAGFIFEYRQDLFRKREPDLNQGGPSDKKDK